MTDNPQNFDLSKILQAAQQVKDKLGNMQEKLARVTVEAESGGGMVKVKANGRGEVLAVRIDPEVVDPEDVGMLEDLTVAAVNQALKKAQEKAREEMQGEISQASGMPIPGMFG
jgi:hypothetical protein